MIDVAFEPLVDSATLLLAQRFLAALPSELAAPELAVDPDGEISFDWFGRSGRNFSVSLRSDGRVAIARVEFPVSSLVNAGLLVEHAFLRGWASF